MSFEKVTKDSINGVIGILNSIEPDRTAEVLQKGKSAMIGEIREWQGKKYKKQSNGKWVEVSEQGMTRKEHEKQGIEIHSERQLIHLKKGENYKIDLKDIGNHIMM